MVVFVVVARACSVVTRDGVTGSARQLGLQLVQQSLHVLRGVRAWQLFFFCLRVLFCILIVDPTFIAGDLGHEFAQSAWDFPRRVSPSCIHCACVVAIDAPVTIIVIMGWVSLLYSGRPHNALVAFVSKATLWLWGWLPWPSLLQLRGLSHERFGASQWWCWSRPLQLVMALIASIEIDHVVVDCCCLSQIRLAPTLTSCLQLRFLLVYSIEEKIKLSSVVCCLSSVICRLSSH